MKPIRTLACLLILCMTFLITVEAEAGAKRKRKPKKKPVKTERVIKQEAQEKQQQESVIKAPAEDPEIHPRQEPGSARVVPVHAVLAGCVGRQYRSDGALSRVALRP